MVLKRAASIEITLRRLFPGNRERRNAVKVLENAGLMQVREEFVAYSKNRRKYTEEQMNEIIEYIMSDECAKDIGRLKTGDFFLGYPQYRLIPKNLNEKKRAVYCFRGTESYLMKLIVFAMRSLEGIYSDRLFSFRYDKTGGDLLTEIRQDRSIRRQGTVLCLPDRCTLTISYFTSGGTHMMKSY